MKREQGLWAVAVAACCLLYAGQGFAEARRVGLVYTWRNELNTDVHTQELLQASVPDTLTPVRGFFFLGSHGGCPGADNRAWARGEGDGREMMQFAKQFGWGLMATSHMCGSEYNMKNTNLLLKALEEFSALGANPEIENVPLILVGASNAGATAYTLVNTIPHKILCVTPIVTASFNPGTPTDAAIRVPGIFATGEFDGSRNNHNSVIGASRARGSLWAWFEVKGMGHEVWRSSHLFRPFWEKAIALRYPADYNPRSDGPIELNAIAESSGWLMSSNWRTAVPTIASFNEYAGTKSTAQWVLDEDLAHMLRGQVIWHSDPRLDLEVNGMLAEWTIPGDPWTIVQPGTEATLRVTPGAFSWNRIEFFRGAVKLGEVSGGTPEYNFTLGTESFAQTFTAAVHSASATRYPLPINVGVIEESGTAIQPQAAACAPRPSARDGLSTLYDLNGRRIAASTMATGLRFEADAQRIRVITRLR